MTPATAPASTSALARLRALPHAGSMACAVLLIGLASSLTAPYLPLFGVQVAHMSPFALGAFMTLLALSSIVVSLQLGRVSDRLASRKPVVLLTAAAATLGYVLLTTTTSYALLCVIAAVFLGTGAASFPQLFAFTRTRFGDVPPALAEQGLTTLRSVFSLAWVVGPGVGAAVQGALGFHGLFLVTAALYASAGVVILRSGVGSSTRTTNAPVQQVQAPAPAGRPPVWAVVSSFVLYGTSMSMGFISLPLYVTLDLHLPRSDVGLIVGLCALLEIPVMLSFVFLQRRTTHQTLIVFAFGLFTLYFLTMALSHTLAPLLLAQIVRAIVIAIAASLGMAYFQDLLPGRVGAATTLFVNTTSVGSVISGLVSGGVAQAYGYRAVFVLCAVLTAGAWLLLLLTARHARRTTPTAP